MVFVIMWADFSVEQFIPDLPFDCFLPAAPHKFYSSVGSIFVAAGIGEVYGLIGRVIYPNIGIIPFHYAVWFGLAFQVKRFVLSNEEDLFDYLKEGEYLEDFEDLSPDKLDFQDQVCFYYWKGIRLRDRIVAAIDDIFSACFDLRSFDEVTEDNVEEASFLEMCRYRIWPVFKMTIVDMVSFSSAYHFSRQIGFALPDRTAVPLLILIHSIVQEIILIPALHTYARLCKDLADQSTSSHHYAWIWEYLPPL